MSSTESTKILGVIEVRDAVVSTRFWALWVLNSLIAGFVALAIAAETPPFAAGVVPSGDEANVEGYSALWAVIAGGVLAGAALGAMQWLILGRIFSGAGERPGGRRQHAGRWWIVASATGFGLGFTVVWAAGGGAHAAEYAHHGLPHAVDRAGTWGGVLLGAMLGGAQWLVLRTRPGLVGSRASLDAWWWMPANIIGFATGWWAAASVSASVEPVLGPLTHFWGGAAFGGVLGMITGIRLAFIPRSHDLA